MNPTNRLALALRWLSLATLAMLWSWELAALVIWITFWMERVPKQANLNTKEEL